MIKTKDLLLESGLSRVLSHMQDHDCGAMTAFRSGENCGEGKKYSRSDNLKRNKVLLAKLMRRGYSVTKLKGKYPEGGKEQTENSFFIVDIADQGHLKQDLMKFGELFDQDSVLWIPKGGKEGILIGTNKCPNNWLGYHKTENVGKRFLGKGNEIYTSKVKNRPFVFGEECVPPGSGMGIWYMNIVADKDWDEL